MTKKQPEMTNNNNIGNVSGNVIINQGQTNTIKKGKKQPFLITLISFIAAVVTILTYVGIQSGSKIKEGEPETKKNPVKKEYRDSIAPPESRKDGGSKVGSPTQKIISKKNIVQGGEELFIDSMINKIQKVDVAVSVIDSNNRLINSLSSEIASLYRDKSGKTVSTSLFTEDFFESNYVDKLFNANSQLIGRLDLLSRTKIIVICRYSNKFDAGELAKYISRASLDIVVISSVSSSKIDGFQIDASNPYDDKVHAEKGAKEKIIDEYSKKHLNL
jgi:hypothetical protein